MALTGTVFRQAGIYSVAAILARMTSFLMLPVYAYLFQTEGYGIISMVDTSIGILTVFLAGGFQVGILKIYHAEPADNKPLALSTGIQIVWLLAISIAVLPAIFAAPISHFVLGSSEYTTLFLVALATFVIDVAGQSASTYLIIQERAMLFSVIGLLRLILSIILNIVLVIILEVGLIGVFWSSFIAASLSTLTFHIFAIRDHGFQFDRRLAEALLRFQLPLLPGELIGFIGRQSEKVMVRIMIGLSGMGILEMAYKFPVLISYFVKTPFERAWRTKAFEIAEEPTAPQEMGQMFSKYLFFLTFFGLFLAISIQLVIELMTPEDFWMAGRIARIEIVTTTLTACTAFLSFGVLYASKTLFISKVVAVLTPIKVALAVGMIWSLGLAGAAYSALIIEIITMLWIFRKAQSLYRVEYEFSKLAVIVGVALVFFLALYNNRYENFGPAIWLANSLVSPVVDFLSTTSVGEWRSGRVIEVLREKQPQAVALMINCTLGLGYLGLYPFVFRSRQNSADLVPGG